MQQSLGRKIVNLLGMSSLGQKTKENSLSVTIASDQIISSVPGVKQLVFSTQKNALEVLTPLPLPASAAESRSRIIVQNLHATGNLYIGGSSVATTDGYKLIPGASFDIALGEDFILYGLSDAANNAMDVRIIEFI